LGNLAAHRLRYMLCPCFQHQSSRSAEDASMVALHVALEKTGIDFHRQLSVGSRWTALNERQ